VIIGKFERDIKLMCLSLLLFSLSSFLAFTLLGKSSLDHTEPVSLDPLGCAVLLLQLLISRVFEILDHALDNIAFSLFIETLLIFFGESSQL
jgi:hypothetical protein